MVTKRSHILKQTCSWKLQVLFKYVRHSCYHQALKGWHNVTIFFCFLSSNSNLFQRELMFKCAITKFFLIFLLKCAKSVASSKSLILDNFDWGLSLSTCLTLMLILKYQYLQFSFQQNVEFFKQKHYCLYYSNETF